MRHAHVQHCLWHAPSALFPPLLEQFYFLPFRPQFLPTFDIHGVHEKDALIFIANESICLCTLLTYTRYQLWSLLRLRLHDFPCTLSVLLWVCGKSHTIHTHYTVKQMGVRLCVLAPKFGALTHIFANK